MRLALALFAALLAGCLDRVIDDLDPRVGAPLAPRCVNEDSDPGEEVSFARQILPIFAAKPGCGCHLPASPNPIGIEETGLDLSSYAKLRAGGVNSLSAIVIPGEPCNSILWQKITPGPPFGARMPFNGPPFLGEAERKRIADWIAEGARDN